MISSMTNDYEVDLTDSGEMPKDIEDVVEVSSGTILEQLTTALAKEIVRPDIEIDVPERDGISIQYSPNITQERLRQWRKNSGESSKRGLDSVKFASYVIGDTCKGIYVNHEQAVSPSGVGLTFTSREIWEMSDADSPFEAIKHMFGIDPHIESTAFAILEAAGYGDEVDTEDPTGR